MLVVAGVTAHHAAQCDQRRMPARQRQLARGQRQLPGARHPDHVDHRRRHAVADQRALRAVDQGIGDARVPAADQNRERAPGTTRRSPS
jgi:hypothetical protein